MGACGRLHPHYAFALPSRKEGMMAIIDEYARLIQKLAEEYVGSHDGQSRPISLQSGIRAIRSATPGLNHTDRDLADIIAATAVSRGHCVDFDDQSPETGSPS
jgi:hypothetical protein